MKVDVVRDATAADAEAIAEIYAPFVRATTISFEEEVPDAAEIARRIARHGALYPWLVGERDGAIVGYAYARPFHERAAYRWAVETTVYVSREHPRQGIGYAIYAPLLTRLEASGFISAIGIVTLPNLASIRLHEALGFLHTGTNRRIGYKFGAWHDVGSWQRELAPRMVPPVEPRLAR